MCSVSLQGLDAECQYAECNYSECRYAESHGADVGGIESQSVYSCQYFHLSPTF